MKKIIFALILFVFFSQSSYAGLFKFDPEAKLKEVDYMMRIGRDIAADKLINDVIVYCKKKNDEACLVKAFYYYGSLLMARIPDGYDREKNSARKILGYVDDSVTIGNIDQKAIEYFNKALDLAKKHGINDAASAIYIKMGILQYTRFKDQAAACNSFDSSLEYHLLFKKNNPNIRVIVPKGFGSFEEYISQAKSEINCSKQ